MINKYIKIYIKRNCLFSLLWGSIVFFPLFAEALVEKNTLRDTAFAILFAFTACTTYVGITLLPTVRFKKLIRRQEQLYKVRFDDYGAVHLEKTVYLSRNWLIYAGKVALYIKHIKSISSEFIFGKGPSFYKLNIKTVDGKKYNVKCYDSSNVIKIKKLKRRN